jgi:phenylacetaldehyde dehydrogenase
MGLTRPLTLGRWSQKEQHMRLAGFLHSGRQQGAEVATGGKAIGNRGYFVEPTFLTHADRLMRVVREEIFGPVCVQSLDDTDLDAVAKFTNDTEYALEAVSEGETSKLLT